MGIVNAFMFTNTVIDADKFLNATHNRYRVVSVRPYVDKKGVLPEGFNLTLQVLKDDMDYGIDKDGKVRENNLYQNFDVTVLSRQVEPKKGDMIKLSGFDSENSYVIGFDLLMRFRNIEVIPSPNKVEQRA